MSRCPIRLLAELADLTGMLEGGGTCRYVAAQIIPATINSASSRGSLAGADLGVEAADDARDRF